MGDDERILSMFEEAKQVEMNEKKVLICCETRKVLTHDENIIFVC